MIVRRLSFAFKLRLVLIGEAIARIRECAKKPTWLVKKHSTGRF
jgi:hypothetical protein